MDGSEAPAMRTGTTGRSCVLVVEDNGDAREWMRRVLEKDGHYVAVASGGRDALKLLCTIACDVVITDLMMPDMDGVELVRELTATRPEIPIVVVSGSGSTLLRAARIFGAVATLRKPVTAPLLRESVRALLPLRPRYRTPSSEPKAGEHRTDVRD
jgi:CheY-like chemotaxis protein